MRAAHLYVAVPRHPVLRVLVLAAGGVLLAGLIAMGLVVGTAVVIAVAVMLLVRRWLGGRGRRQAEPDVIEGEFTVVAPRPRASLPRAE